ncbi:MAG TPA: hypothetical protein VFO95_00700 [Gemmatimonadales bacterium]|nr:hypothetical protein [Gemmatimonadales bacterium]
MSFNRTGTQVTGWLLALSALAGATSAVTAQNTQRVHLGIRTGSNFEYSDASLGAQVTVPLGQHFELYPSADAYFPEEGSRFGFNADLKYRIPTNTAIKFYSGAGLGMIRRAMSHADEHHWGANLIGGLEHRTTWVHPFLETRVMFYDQTSVGLAAGINFTLGHREQ